MPTRNIIKQYDANGYYHIYSRGVDKQAIFRKPADYTVFISLFKRYLSRQHASNPQRHSYPNYHEEMELIAYALMPNHFHLFVYQKNPDSITKFMRSVLTSYSMYFNKENHRVGPVFQSRYLGKLITKESYFAHITRYIHLNPSDWRHSPYTSLDYFLGRRTANWLNPGRVLDMTPDRYMHFLEDYTDRKRVLDDIKWDLANQDVDED